MLASLHVQGDVIFEVQRREQYAKRIMKYKWLTNCSKLNETGNEDLYVA